MQILKIAEEKKGKVLVHTDSVGTFPVYRREVSQYGIREGMEWPEEMWEQLCAEVLRKRVTKRAMFLLQRMDRTETQLRQKLKENSYPEELIDVALDYVKSYHYVDDLRYAENYIRFHQDSKSRFQLKLALQQKGVSGSLIDEALEAEYEGDEDALIQSLLEKKHYDPENMDEKERNKIFQFLMRKGFSAEGIRRHMNLWS